MVHSLVPPAPSRKPPQVQRHSSNHDIIIIIVVLGMESSQPISITDQNSRRKKKRRRAGDSFTGKFCGNLSSWTFKKHLFFSLMCLLSCLHYYIYIIWVVHYQIFQNVWLHFLTTLSDWKMCRVSSKVCVSVVDLYRLTDELLGQGAYAKVQGCVSLQNDTEYAVKVRWRGFFFIIF